MTPKAARILVLALMFVTVGCDRVTKQLAAANLVGVVPVSYLGDTIRLEYTENAGAFLSLGENLPDWARTGVFVIGVGALLLAVAYLAIRHRWSGGLLIGAALMWAGGLSNLVDRIVRGHVVDFINLGVGSLRTGIFNIADVAIITGVALILIESARKEDVLA